ncbi:MAG: hypothetical protein ACR2PU_01120 [Gammaproteobacteria bacterium]
MKYLLLAAVVIMSLSACDLFREKSPGEGKPGQYPPSLWDKRDSAPPGPDDSGGDAGSRHEAPAE